MDEGVPQLGLLGDVMLGRMVGRAVRHGVPPHALWSPELRELCRSLDLVVVNLECALSERGERTRRIRGKPFFFRGPPGAVGALQAVGTRVASLANNHALDYGEAAAADTVATLAAAGIAAVGAGPGVAAARRPAVVGAGPLRVGIVAVADHPAEYAAGRDEAAAPGAEVGWGTAYAPLAEAVPAWLLDAVAALRVSADLVIAFPHWGPNMTSAPAAWQLAVAEQLQEAGADLVAGHSAHVFHGVGPGSRGPVVYDLGGALDDYAVDATLRNDLGLLAVWRPGEGLDLVGLRIDHGQTRLASGEDADWIAARLHGACSALGTRIERRDEHRFAVLSGR